MSFLPAPVLETYRFGVFDVDIRSGQLRKNGVVIKLRPQPFRILVLLVRRAGQVVNREEIQREVWGETQVDFEIGLNRCIRQVRAALSDDADVPKYIETVPRTGYRFVAPVTIVLPEPRTHAPAVAPPVSASSVADANVSVREGDQTPTRSIFNRRLVLTGLGAVLLLAAGIAVSILLLRPRVATSPLTTEVVPVPITAYPGEEYSPAFSPDGAAVAYTWNGRDRANFDIYVEVIGSRNPIRLTTDPGADFSPRWSRDGKSIAFLRDRSGKATSVMVVPASGGPERELYRDEDHFAVSDRPLDWSPDGSFLFLAHAADGSMGISRISLSSGDMLRLSRPPPGQGDVGLALSPDGRTLAFVRDVGNSVSRLYLLGLDRDFRGVSEPKSMDLLPCSSSLCQNPEWTSDGRYVLFSSNFGGSFRIWRVAASGGAPEVLPGLDQEAVTVAVARSGQRIAFARREEDTSIRRLDLRSAQAGEFDATPVLESTRLEHRPRISPNGQLLAFESNGTGSFEIWVAAVDGSYSRPITKLGAVGSGSPAWSPDGSRLVFDSRQDGQAEIYEIAIAGGAIRRLTTHDAADVLPAYSPDGRFVYFASERSGRSEIWRIPVHGGEPVQVTRNGARSFTFSPDGMTLYYIKTSTAGPLWQFPLAGGEEKIVADSVLQRCFGVVNEGVYFVSPESAGGYVLKFRRFRDGAVRKLIAFPRPIVPGVSISADGRFAYYGEVDQSQSDLLLIEGFR